MDMELLPPEAPPAGSTLAERSLHADALLQHLFEQEDSGGTPNWELLRGLPGICLEPLSWQEVQAILQDGSAEALSRMGRPPQHIKVYLRHCGETIKLKYSSVIDHLYVRVFNLPTARDADGKLRAVVPDDFGTSVRVELCSNEFPYSFEAGVEHLNLWASAPLTPEQTGAEVAARLPGREVLWWVNPGPLMFLKDIWHAHVLVRGPPLPAPEAGGVKAVN